MSDHAEVIKGSLSTLRWEVRVQGALLRRFSIKKIAEGYARLVNGDLTGAPDFYKALVEYYQKRQDFPAPDAWQHAALAVIYYARSDQVGADPNTGEPQA